MKMMKMNKDIIVISDFFKRDRWGYTVGLFECHCGKIFSCILTGIKNKRTKSCGCLKNKSKHGLTKSPEFKIWSGMKRRCLNPKASGYENYGARGITICKEWETSFETFYKDIGPRPEGLFSIDRIDNNKGYYKENCRWATRAEQNNNQRSNHRVSYNGKILNLTQWSKELGIARRTLWARLEVYGWTVEKAFTTPSKK